MTDRWPALALASLSLASLSLASRTAAQTTPTSASPTEAASAETAPTHPAPAPPSSSPPPVEIAPDGDGSGFVCGPGSLRLEGASAEAGDAANFQAKWTPLLQRVADCVKRPSMQTACLEVQGRYDDVPFKAGAAPVQNLGSALAAQVARASARGAVVRTKLAEYGVDPKRLIEVPPPDDPSYRGVQLTIRPGCLPAPLPEPEAEPVTEAEPEPVTEPISVTVTVPAPAPEPAPRTQAGLYLQGALAGTGILSDVADDLYGSLSAGALYRSDGLYGRAQLGLTLAESGTQHAGFELQAGIGFAPLAWLSAGAVLAFRQASDALNRSWFQRAFSVGLESAQCAPVGGEQSPWDLCLREAFHPLGRSVLRGELVGGQAFQVPRRDAALVRFDIGVLIARRL